MNFTVIIYSIIIALYVVIATITILALIGKVEIKSSYMKVLFTKVILGIIGGFTYLFYSSGEVSFSKDPSEIYAYDKTGTSTSFIVYQGDSSVASINQPGREEFINVLRNYIKDENKMYILDQDSVYLGYINIDGGNEEGFISLENKLHLGLYYSQNKEIPGYGNLAVEYLIEILREHASAPEEADAVRGLYSVITSINKPENFKLLLSKMRIYLSPPSKYYEIAEAFRVYYSATNTDRTKKNLGALRNYLLYFVNTPESLNSDNPAVRKKHNNMIENIYFYVRLLKNSYPQLPDADEMKSELEDYNINRIQTLIESLPVIKTEELDS